MGEVSISIPAGGDLRLEGTLEQAARQAAAWFERWFAASSNISP